MAILKKSKIGSKLITIIVVVAVLAVGVPLVSAYEAHTINVKVSIEERFNCFKTIRPATVEEINEAIGLGIIPGSLNPVPGPTGDPDDPPEVPTFTCVVWVMTIGIMNPHSYNMTNVVIKDAFGAELGGEPLDEVPVDVIIKYHSRGKSKKHADEDPLAHKYWIRWYVTYQDNGPVPFPEDPDFNPEDYNWDVMEPGDSEYMELLVWTKLNPAGKQEYTSPGDYTLNSGPTAKWFDAPPEEGGHQFSFDGESLHVTAVEY